MNDKTNKDFENGDLLFDIFDEEIKQTAPVEDDDLFIEEMNFDEVEEELQVANDGLEDELDALEIEKAEASGEELEDEWLDDIIENYDYEASSQHSVDETDSLLSFLNNGTISDAYHPWRISLYEKLPFVCEDNGIEKVFLVGYNNGQMARQKETHFQQHETDPIPYIITLDPDPHFMSYSFFYGFFRETLEKMCINNYSEEELRVTVKKKTAEDFFAKYTFDFRNNPSMFALVKEYVATMVENIVDSLDKRGG